MLGDVGVSVLPDGRELDDDDEEDEDDDDDEDDEEEEEDQQVADYWGTRKLRR